MKKEYLIPIGKSRKVIYLDRRGKKVTRPHPVTIVFAVLGILCLLYCLSIMLFMGYGTLFFLMWVALAVGCGAGAVLSAHREWLQYLPKWLKRSCLGVIGVGALLFIVVEGLILGQFTAKAQSGADYVIVLGAQWKESGPSYVLQKRLDKTLEYLKENPDTLVIVSGGQGSNEPISEAQGMRDYLEKAGIAPERIFMEDKSTNTKENLVYSAKLLDESADRVVVVTNNFHVFRACSIASKQGYLLVEGLAAESYPGMLPNNLLREFMGVIKDIAVGNM